MLSDSDPWAENHIRYFYWAMTRQVIDPKEEPTIINGMLNGHSIRLLPNDYS